MHRYIYTYTHAQINNAYLLIDIFLQEKLYAINYTIDKIGTWACIGTAGMNIAATIAAEIPSYPITHGVFIRYRWIYVQYLCV